MDPENAKKPSIPPEWADRVDALCDRFEADFASDQSPKLEDYLEDVPREERSVFLQELLLVELECLKRGGESPRRVDYLARFSQHAEIVAAAFDRVMGDAFATLDATNADTDVSDQPVPPTVNFTIDKYHVTELLGRGGQAEVYRAVHSELPGRRVVIKLAREAFSAEARNCIIEEGKKLAECDIPGVVQVYDVGIHKDRPYIVLEDVRGRSLDKLLQGKPLPVRESTRILADVAEVVHQVHLHGLLHRDLKPANVLIGTDGTIKLLDFGLTWEDSVWTTGQPGSSTTLAGSLPYMAPEQAECRSADFGPWTDVFGLGATLYHLLTGVPPYSLDRTSSSEGHSAFEQLLELAKKADILPPREINSRLPRRLERICLKALAALPQDRYESAIELAESLRSELRGRRWMVAALAAATMLPCAAAVALLSSSAKKDLPTPGPEPEVSLEPKLDLLVAKLNTAERLSPIEAPEIRPVRNDELVRIQVRLNKPAYIHLVWIDSIGKPSVIYSPRVAGPPKPLQTLIRPEGIAGYPLKGKSGLESLMLLVRKSPLPADFDLLSTIGTLPPAAFNAPHEFVRFKFDCSQSTIFAQSNVDSQEKPVQRAIDLEAREIEDPMLQLIQQLRPHFDVIEVVRFAHLGE